MLKSTLGRPPVAAFMNRYGTLIAWNPYFWRFLKQFVEKASASPTRMEAFKIEVRTADTRIHTDRYIAQTSNPMRTGPARWNLREKLRRQCQHTACTTCDQQSWFLLRWLRSAFDSIVSIHTYDYFLCSFIFIHRVLVILTIVLQKFDKLHCKEPRKRRLSDILIWKNRQVVESFSHLLSRDRLEIEKSITRIVGANHVDVDERSVTKAFLGGTFESLAKASAVGKLPVRLCFCWGCLHIFGR